EGRWQDEGKKRPDHMDTPVQLGPSPCVPAQASSAATQNPQMKIPRCRAESSSGGMMRTTAAYEQRRNAVMRSLRSLARPPILDMWFRTLNSFGVVSHLQRGWPSSWIDPSLMRRHAV